MCNRVLVLDREKKPLMPCTPARARILLSAGKAAVYRRVPFTIILKDRDGGDVQPIAFKVDPGSKISGVVLVADFAKRGKTIVFAAEVEHRGQAVKAALDVRRAVRRSRRQRHTRYRPPRFDNRTRQEGWLPPSLRSRIGNILTWLRRLASWTPITAVGMELIKFDLQGMENPEISGVEYQRGTLFGYELWEYLLEKWHRTCAYCKKKDVPLEKEHIIPRSRGGTDGVRNLTVACHRCNQRKGNKTAAEFGHPEVEAAAKAPLRDAAVVNASRWALWRELKACGYDIECGSGGRTKFNRIAQDYPKAHWIDAACVGTSGEHVRLDPELKPLKIKATGRGSRQFCGTDKFGFPIRHRTNTKRSHGFQTGDLVRADVPDGKYAGRYVGRVTIRNRPSFRVNGFDLHPRRLMPLQRADGYDYMT